MTIILKLTGFRASDFHVIASPLSELLALLHAVAEPAHHFEARKELDRVMNRMHPALEQEFRSLSPLWARFRSQLFFPFSPKPKTFEEELAELAELPIYTFLELCAESVQGQDISAAPLGDLARSEHDRAAFLEYCLTRSPERHALALALLADPEGTRQRLIHFLGEANERFFQHEWALVREAIHRSVESHSHRARTLPVADAIAELHYSAQHFPESREVRFDKLQFATVPLEGRAVIAVPSVRADQHLMIKRHPGLPVIIHFPIGITNAGPLTIEAMRQRLASLHSGSRMELFRHLAGEAITTTELSARMGWNPAQISRELGTLRAADLVISERRGKRIYHRLNLEKIINLGPDLISILLR